MRFSPCVAFSHMVGVLTLSMALLSFNHCLLAANLGEIKSYISNLVLTLVRIM